MNAVLYINNSEKIKVNKDITKISDITLTLYMSTDISQPVFKVSNFNNNSNYIYVSELNRYYYINSVTYDKQCAYLYCSIDVLMTYKTQILNSEQFILRNEFKRNTTIPDNAIPSECNNMIHIIKSDTEFLDNGKSYILGVI